MSFRLSIYSLRRIKNGMQNDKIYAKKRRDKNKKKNKSKVKMCNLGDSCLKRILYWFGIGLELWSACLVAEVCQASKVFLMRKEPLSMTLELSKSMRWWPCMFRNVWSSSTCFDIPDMFFLTSFKTPAGFAYITPITIGAGYLINWLMFNRWSEFERRKFLLQSLEGLIYNLNFVPSKNSC